jgi:DNA primase
MAGCPFHDSRSKTSFRVNVDTGAFHCFGCGVGGSGVIDFVIKRYRLDFVRAAKHLNAWRGQMSESEKAEIRKSHRDAERKRAAETEMRQAERQERIAARDLLHALEGQYLKAQEAHDIELMADLLPSVREADACYRRLAGLEESYV